MTQTTSHPPQQPAGEPPAFRAALQLESELMKDEFEGTRFSLLYESIESACREAVEAATKPLMEALSGMVSAAHRLDFDPETRLGIATAEAEKALAQYKSLHRREEGKL